MIFNIRECDNSIKRRKLSQILLKKKVDMCFIQETGSTNGRWFSGWHVGIFGF